MRSYIEERISNTTRFFKFGNIEVEEQAPTSPDVDLAAIFKAVENNLPSHYFKNLRAVKIGNFADLQNKNFSALYDDGIFYIDHEQPDSQSILNDVVHEFAHHIESIYTDLVYGDKKVVKEFLKKRAQLKFELRTEGYWVSEYDFNNLKYDEKLDEFLYKRVGKNMLKMVTTGLFIRPYASISLREYFATGFEAFYLGRRNELEKICPSLYNKILEVHNFRD